MNRSNKIIAAIVLACATTIAPARSADNLTGAMIRAYNAGHYESAEALGEKVVAKHPKDYSARYYLANTYVLLHKNEQAIDQYRICLYSGRDGALKEYSSTALERLLKQKEQALLAASKSSAQAKDKEIKDFKKKLHTETKQEEQRLRQEWNQALARLDSNNGGGGRRGYRGGYGMRSNFFSERNQLNESYSRRIAELADHEASMVSQANCGIGKIRLQPSLSSSKVRNYINYGDESDAVEIPVDNPLRAQARSLSDVIPPAATSAPGRKSAKPAAAPKKSFHHPAATGKRGLPSARPATATPTTFSTATDTQATAAPAQSNGNSGSKVAP